MELLKINGHFPISLNKNIPKTLKRFRFLKGLVIQELRRGVIYTVKMEKYQASHTFSMWIASLGKFIQKREVLLWEGYTIDFTL